MFENVIGNGRTVARLRAEIVHDRFPGAVLFSGPAFAGKSTAALEAARALSCERRTADWACSCRSCEMHRYLIHPDTLVFGNRPFVAEIAASADVLARTRKSAAQFLYARAVRKLERRFDGILWEGLESRRSQANSLLEEIEDQIDPLMPGRELPAEAQITKRTGRIADTAIKLAALVSDAVPIGFVRNALFWAHATGQGKAKVVIIESADLMLENARSALLKMLEEPPSGVYFLLSATRPGRIMPTIRSRLRPYSFSERSATDTAEVLEKIFRESSGRYQTLRQYFLAWSEQDTSRVQTGAARFLAGAREGLPFDEELLADFGEHFELFAEELTALCDAKVRESAGATDPADRLEAYATAIREATSQHQQYNQGAKLVLESLYYRLKRLSSVSL